MTYELVSKTRVEYGVELTWEYREPYGPIWTEHSGVLSDNPPKGTLLEAGTVFISFGMLEELLEAEYTWGMREGFSPGYHEGMALEKAGLATSATRGGYYCSDEQRARVEALLEDLRAQLPEA